MNNLEIRAELLQIMYERKVSKIDRARIELENEADLSLRFLLLQKIRLLEVFNSQTELIFTFLKNKDKNHDELTIDEIVYSDYIEAISDCLMEIGDQEYILECHEEDPESYKRHSTYYLKQADLIELNNMPNKNDILLKMSKQEDMLNAENIQWLYYEVAILGELSLETSEKEDDVDA